MTREEMEMLLERFSAVIAELAETFSLR